jgi:hypothetical protein
VWVVDLLRFYYLKVGSAKKNSHRPHNGQNENIGIGIGGRYVGSNKSVLAIIRLAEYIGIS